VDERPGGCSRRDAAVALHERREDRLTEQADDVPVEVRRFTSRADAEQHALVLAAVGIACQLVARAGAIGLCVADADAARARAELASYSRENQRRREYPPPTRGLIDGREGLLIYCALLLFLNGAARRQMFAQDWVAVGAAQAGLIVDGAWWRTVTALGLHADMGHLVSNLAFGGLLGLLLAPPLGPGLAWLAILLSGALGNALNALLQPATHTAIGASTAVFGALGLLAALTWRSRAMLRPRGLRRWLPFGGALMLLAYLGFGGERTDIGGHVAGFVTGCALGVPLAWAATWVPQGPAAQRAYGASALGLIALAWLLALHVPE
jgi:membrane associated rhomboid family serine protease